MLRLVKAFHLLGLAMFFGSILGHVTMGFLPAAENDPRAILFVRQAIDVATTYLTLPGLGLLVLTGLVMVVGRRLPILKLRWLALHAIFALLIVMNAAVVLYPTGQELLGVVSQGAAGALDMERVFALKGRETAFGAANVLLSLAAVFVAAVKPRMGSAKLKDA